MRLATYLFMNVVRYMVCAFNWCFKCSHLLYCRRVCLLSGLIFLSLLEKRPLRIANSDNLPETDWLGLGMYAPGIFQPYLKTLHHLLFSRSYWYVIFFFFYLRTNSRWQTEKSKEEQKNSICNFLSIPPWLQTDTRIILASVVLFWFFFYRSLSLAWLFLKLKSDILFVMSPCSPAVTSPQCLRSRYYFWLSVLHLRGTMEPLSFSVS